MGPWQADAVGWEDRTEAKVYAHGVSPAEVEQVFRNSPDWFRNKKNRAGNWAMVGVTDGGRRVTVIVRWDADLQSSDAQAEEMYILRVITAWEDNQ